MLLCAAILNSKVANMQELKTLIDKAAKVCGSDKALAEKLGVHPPTLSAMRKDRTITPETAAELADIAGENVKLAVYQAMIERAKGTRREGVLREILGKSLLAGVVAMSLFSYTPEAKAVTISGEKLAKVLTQYTSWNIALRWLRRLLTRFSRAAPRPVCRPAPPARTTTPRPA